jgi:hypothetical protein
MEILNIVESLPRHPTKRYSTRSLSEIEGLVVHHFGSLSTVENVAAYHVSKGWPGIGYHFVVERDGVIKQTNYLTWVSYHVGDPNRKTIGMALNGGFMTSPPPQKQLDSARWLVSHIKSLENINITKEAGHGQYPGGTLTACPGATWPQWLPYVFTPHESPEQEEDMKWFELYPCVELIDKGHNQQAKVEGEYIKIPGVSEDAKQALVRVTCTGKGSWVSVGHRKEGLYASLLSAYSGDNPGSCTSLVPLTNGGLYYLAHAPQGVPTHIWVRVYGYYR